MDWADVTNMDNVRVQEFLNNKGQDQLGGNSASGTMVMTEEQMEMLKKQIVVFQILSDRLVQMYKDISCAQSVPGMRMEEMHCDPPLLSPEPELKITMRQRWSPTPMQLQILESIFVKGNGIPDKQKIREITVDLSQYGMISEAKVYNWFQNRRARSKRIQKRRLLPKRAAAGAENDSGVNAGSNKRSRTVDTHQSENPKSPRSDDQTIDSEKFCSELLLTDAEDDAALAFLSFDDDRHKSSEGLNHNDKSAAEKEEGVLHLLCH